MPSGLLGLPIVRPSVGIEGTEESLRLDDLPQALQAAHRIFFLDEEGRIDFRGRVIQRHNEVPLTAGHSFMSRAILMQHHARQRFARPLLAMRPAPQRAQAADPPTPPPPPFHISRATGETSAS